jgi:hypothetical protein
MIGVLALGCSLGWVVRQAHFQSDAVGVVRRAGAHRDFTGSFSGRIRMLALTRAPWLIAFRFMVVTGLVALPQASASPDNPGKTSKAASGVAATTISGRVTDQAGAPLADVRVSVVAIVDPETRAVDAGALSKQLVARSDARGTIGSRFPVSRSVRSS